MAGLNYVVGCAAAGIPTVRKIVSPAAIFNLHNKKAFYQC